MTDPIVICPGCNKPAPWVANKERYGRNFGESFMCYFCEACDTYVGCHQNTRHPLGTMADKPTTRKRQEVHAVLDPYWKDGAMTRGEVYFRVAELMEVDQFHVGECDAAMCDKAIDLIENDDELNESM